MTRRARSRNHRIIYINRAYNKLSITGNVQHCPLQMYVNINCQIGVDAQAPRGANACNCHFSSTDNCRLLCPRPVGGWGGIKRSSASVVRPSVCLYNVAYIGSNSKTKRPRKTKLCTGVPQATCDSHTDFKVKRSKVKVSRGGGILWRPPSRTACYLDIAKAFGRVNHHLFARQ